MARSKKKTTNAVARDTVTLNSVFTDIANAIREKTGGSDTITPRNMGNAIRGIKGVTEASLPEANLPAVFQDMANAIRACGITGTMTASQMAGKIGDIVVDQYHSDTWYKYAGDTEWRTVSITGAISGSRSYPQTPTTQIPDVANIVALEIGSDVTSIVDYAFLNCNSITNLTIPDSVTSIGTAAFKDCDGLTSVTIPNNVTTIKFEAFSYMDALQNIFLYCNSLSGIENYAFGWLNGLKNVTVQKTIVETQSAQPINWFGGVGYNRHSITITCIDGSFIITPSCILKGTDILLADGTTKKIEDLTYDDVLKVWDFDEGQLGSAKVCWLTKPGLTNNHYYQLTFDNGTVLKTTGINSNHRIFSVDQSKFTNVCDAKVGDKVFSIDGTLTITDVKYIEEECEYYNVMTSGKINCFANGILTSDRYGNIYPIADMKYVKDGRTIRPYSEYEAVGIDRYWYDNLRLGENTETVEKSKEYVWKCLGQMFPIPN